MLSFDDHSGIISFLVGIVVIVMTAVGLSMLVDHRFKFSAGTGEVRRELAARQAEYSKINARLSSRSETLAEKQAKRESAASGLMKARIAIKSNTSRKEDLLNQRERLHDQIKTAESTFADYRADYRQKARSTAAGEEIGTLRVRGGREYLEATITKVTEVGLEIRHTHGFARIHAPDLDAAWQDRFQWSDEERRAKLGEEMKYRESLAVAEPAKKRAKPQVRARPSRPRSQPAEVPEAEDLTALRTLVSGWQTRVFRLESEHAEAVSNANYGSATSVPGSLETWKARAARLGRELSRAHTEYSVARGRLAAVAPNDPLLVIPAPGVR